MSFSGLWRLGDVVAFYQTVTGPGETPVEADAPPSYFVYTGVQANPVATGVMPRLDPGSPGLYAAEVALNPGAGFTAGIYCCYRTWKVGGVTYAHEDTFQILERLNANIESVRGDEDAAQRLARHLRLIGTVVVRAPGTLSAVPATISPAPSIVNQFRDRVLVFDWNTVTPALQGQARLITGSAVDGTLTIGALQVSPQVGDSGCIV